MDISKIQSIKQKVEMFPNTAFVTLVEEGKMLIQNKKTNGQYIVSFVEDGDAIIFDTTQAQCVVEPKQSPYVEFKNNCDMLYKGMKSVFSEEKFEAGIAVLKNKIKTLPVVDSKAILEDVNKAKKETKEIFNENIQKLFGKGIKEYQKARKEFETLFSIFNESDELVKGQFVDLNTLKNKIKEQAKNYEMFVENANKFYAVKQELKKIFAEDKVVEKFLEKFDLSKDLKNTVTSKLVKIINEDHLNLNVKETLPKVVSILENQYTGIAGTPSPVVYNLATDNKFKTPRFFKFKMGAYSQNDVKHMINEMDFYMSCIGDHDEESLKDISNSKMILEYMYHSGQINDHLIDEMIRTFNGKYAKDQESEYNDPSKRLAWQNREQQDEGNQKGYAQ